MAIIHGQDISSEFIDELLDSIVNSVPDRQWVRIKKNYDKVVAGIKHIIDEDCFGMQMELVFSQDYAYFKKRVEEPPRKAIAKPISNFSEEFWKEQDALMVKQRQEAIEKQKRAEERKLYKTKKRGTRR